MFLLPLPTPPVSTISMPVATSVSIVGAQANRSLFRIQVVDAETGRGVPLVELRMTNDVVYVTDSAGNAAIDEPSFLGKQVYFSVKSHGYEFPADNFGYRGMAVLLTEGGRATLKIKRLNIAERLYRITGEGIYGDTLKLGLSAPTKLPLLNGGVVGQDSVLMVPYRGEYYWFWGDTSQAPYPLGNFRTTGATSKIPAHPEKGIDLNYFLEPGGFTKKTLPIPGEGPVWVSGVATVDSGDKLIAYYTRVQGLEKALEKGVARFNDRTFEFEPFQKFDEKAPMPLSGHPFTGVAKPLSGDATGKAQRYLFGVRDGSDPFPFIRVPAKFAALRDLKSYEAYSCREGATGKIERDASGRPDYRWRKGGSPLSYDEAQRLVKSGELKPSENPFQIREFPSGKLVHPAGGSVYWNAFRKRWTMILEESFGVSSYVGEIWFAEADTPVGPWVYAKKILTHDKYDFYNPTQHPEFDAEGGGKIYFEGTYVNTFSGNPVATPRYNYNQILYSLDLRDDRLTLPVPVYRLVSGEYGTRSSLPLPIAKNSITEIPFFALPPGCVQSKDRISIRRGENGWEVASGGAGEKALFVAISPGSAPPPDTLALKNAKGELLGYVWKNPSSLLLLDFDISQVKMGE